MFEILADVGVSVADFQKQPEKAFDVAVGGKVIAIFTDNKPTHYLLSAEMYQTLIAKIDPSDLA